MHSEIKSMRRRKKGLSFYQKKKKVNKHILKEIFIGLFETFAVILLTIVLVFSLGKQTNIIGVSMEPTLYNGQKILINRFIYKIKNPQKGDVIVFLPNGNQNVHYYVKRVVAVPGEIVQIVDGQLYINGVLEDNDVYDKMEDAGLAENEIFLGNNEYFVLGDNRNVSEDSRSGNIGSVHRDTIYGKAWYHLGKGDEGEGLGIIR